MCETTPTHWPAAAETRRELPRFDPVTTICLSCKTSFSAQLRELRNAREPETALSHFICKLCIAGAEKLYGEKIESM